ncbi:MAG: membrane protein insertase YidC [Bacteroidaceae bacterium]|nr:membrane protein insertase YidC [Bacteroidaceae bacterium]
MNRDTLIGIVLIAAVIIGFGIINQPSQEEIAAMREADSIAQVEQKLADIKAQIEADSIMKAKADTAALDTNSLFGTSMHGSEQTLKLQNSLVTLDINTHGGVISKAVLKEFKNQEKQPVVLFDENNSSLNFALAMKQENLNTKDIYFEPSAASDSTLTLTAQGANGSELQIVYRLRHESYMVDMTLSAKGMDNFFDPGRREVIVEWTDSLTQQERGYRFEQQRSYITYKEKGEGTDYLRAEIAKSEQIAETLDWVAFKNQFFSYVLISYEDFHDVTLATDPLPQGSGYLSHYSAQMKTAFDPSGTKPTRMQLYIGPNKYRLLQKMNANSIDGRDLELQELVYLGWPLFKYINRYITIYLFDGLTAIGLSMGLVLLVITIILKIIVYPATKKSYLSSAKMRVLRPKVEEISKKYPNKEDSLKKQQEMMQLYSQYGANPMGGCLPMLIQMPIWIAMFNFVPNAIELRQQPFLWADDLSTYENILTWKEPIWGIGDHLSIFCVLFCVSNLLYSWLNMRMQKDTMAMQGGGGQMKMMQWMMMLMPVVFFFIFNDYGSGLNYYYFISLFGSALTMWFLRWRTDDAKLLQKLEENYRKNKDNPKKMSGFAARMKAMQEMQERQRQQRRR